MIRLGTHPTRRTGWKFIENNRLTISQSETSRGETARYKLRGAGREHIERNMSDASESITSRERGESTSWKQAS